MNYKELKFAERLGEGVINKEALKKSKKGLIIVYDIQVEKKF
ncbi:MAG: hypothetical protein WD052_14350 [Bacteroidales bacterium]